MEEITEVSEMEPTGFLFTLQHQSKVGDLKIVSLLLRP